MSDFMQLNLDVLRILAELRTPFLEMAFLVITKFGEELIPIVLLCMIYWCINKRLAYGIGVCFFATGTIVQGMKIGFRIPRPWDLDPGFAAVASEQAKLYGSYSFPSGHTQTAAALFGTLGFWFKNKALKIVCFLLVILVALSRMVLGVHTPLDVGVSLVLTLAAAYIAAKLLCGGRPSLPEIKTSAKTDWLVFFIILGLALVLFIMAFSFNSRGIITDNYTIDSVKQAASAISFAAGFYIERKWIHFQVKTKTIWGQALKYVAGIAGALLIKEGLKLLIGSGIVADGFRYFLLLFWISALYPLIIKMVVNKRAGAAVGDETDVMSQEQS